MWYSFLGVVQLTVWEAIFMHCYATNQLPFMSDEQAFSNPWNITMFVLAAFWVPIYIEFHFYFAHRFNILIIYISYMSKWYKTRKQARKYRRVFELHPERGFLLVDQDWPIDRTFSTAFKKIIILV